MEVPHQTVYRGHLESSQMVQMRGRWRWLCVPQPHKVCSMLQCYLLLQRRYHYLWTAQSSTRKLTTRLPRWLESTCSSTCVLILHWHIFYHPLTSPQRQTHPQHLNYAQLGPKPEGLPHSPPPDSPPSQYATILPHAVPNEKGTCTCMYCIYYIVVCTCVIFCA